MAKVLFYLDPFFELNNPFKMQGWVSWYAEIHEQLKINLIDYDARLIALDTVDLVPCASFRDIVCSFSQEELRGGKAQAGNVFQKLERGQIDSSYFEELVVEKLNGFIPDVIFLNAESRWLRRLLPNSVFLNFELNWFHYEPLPKFWCIDSSGYGKGRFLLEHSEEIFNALTFGDAEREFVKKMIDVAHARVLCKSLYPVAVDAIITGLRGKFAEIILLPLASPVQGDGETRVFASLDYYFDRLPKSDACYVITLHPGSKSLSDGEIKYLTLKYSNIFIDNELRPRPLTQFLVPYVDKVIGNFSSIAYYSLLFNKELIFITENLPYEDDYSHLIAPLSKLISTSSEEFRLKILYWLLTYYAVSDEKFFSGVWMASFINEAISSANNKMPCELYNTQVMTEDEWMGTSWVTKEVKDEYFYQKWFNQRFISQDAQLALSGNEAKDDEFIIHFVMKLLPEQIELLADTLDCIATQSNRAWRLTVVANFDSPNELFDEIDALHWMQVEQGSGFNKVINEMVSTINSGWFAFVEAGVRLEPAFIHSCQQYVDKFKEWKYIYLDEDCINHRGLYCLPKFKPDFDPDLLRSTPYIGSVCLIESAALNTIGGLSEEYVADSYDLALKILDVFGAKAIGHLPEVLVHVPGLYLDFYDEAETFKALSSHLSRNNIDAAVERGWVDRSFRLKYSVIGNPAVSILIHPFSDAFLTTESERLSLLKTCVSSILGKTSYLEFEIVIANTEGGQESLQYFHELKELGLGRVKIVEYKSSYNISAINNFLVEHAKGDYIVFLQPNVEILQEEWIDEMLGHSQRVDVGVVGARLVSSSKQVLHAGEILGMGGKGVVGRAHLNLSMLDPGYMDRAMLVQNFSVVSSACLMIKREIYQKVKGMNDGQFKIGYADGDFCLRVKEQGYRVLFTPFVTLIYSELKRNNKVLNQIQSEIDYMQEKWLPQLATDPAYNRNLSLKNTNFKVDDSMHVTWNVDFKGKSRIYAFPPDSHGVGQYRVRGPVAALTKIGVIESAFANNFSNLVYPTAAEIERIKPDVLLSQNGFLDSSLMPWKKYRKFNDAFMICGLDDLVYMLPNHHPKQGKWPKNIRRKVKELFQASDRVIVANEALAEEFRKMTHEVIVVPNYLENWRWESLAIPEKIQKKKIRIGWAGGSEHVADLEFIRPVVEALYKEVDWVFMGLCLEGFEPYIKEYYAGVDFDRYPQLLANLNLDLAIAPLTHNKFNECKTNLRLLEYGVLGWPVVCTDILPYQNAPVTRVANNVNEWIRVIREKINDRDNLQMEGAMLRQWVIDNYMLDDHLDEWESALLPS